MIPGTCPGAIPGGAWSGACPQTIPEGTYPVMIPEGACPVTIPEGACPGTIPEGAYPVTIPEGTCLGTIPEGASQNLPGASRSGDGHFPGSFRHGSGTDGEPSVRSVVCVSPVPTGCVAVERETQPVGTGDTTRADGRYTYHRSNAPDEAWVAAARAIQRTVHTLALQALPRAARIGAAADGVVGVKGSRRVLHLSLCTLCKLWLACARYACSIICI